MRTRCLYLHYPTLYPTIAFFLLFFCTAVDANGPTVGRDAGMIVPIHNQEVQLLSEEVKIILPGSDNIAGSINCLYILKNLSDHDQIFDMAFVVSSYYFASHNYYRSPQFQVNVSNWRYVQRQPTVRYEPIDKSQWKDLVPANVDSLPVWDVMIPPHKTVTVRLRYPVSWTSAAERYFFTYHTKSAALWAGPIKKAKIQLSFGDLMNSLISCQNVREGCMKWDVKPANYTWTDRGYEWEFTDWEPTEDISVTVECPKKEEEVGSRSN